jgi:very-short-patch-repair endonuclease
VARTLLDLADVIDERGVEKAIDQAEVLRVFDLHEVEDVLERAGGRRGASVVRRLVTDYRGPTLTHEELEERFLALCRQASLPNPAVNEWITLDDGIAYKADFLWRAERLIVETDGWGSHRTRRAFESDRRRDRCLRLAGWDVIRFTWRDVEWEPDEVLTFLARFWQTRSAASLR